MYPEDGRDLDSIFRHSDIAMYAVKAGGGNGVEFYDQKMKDQSMHLLQMESNMRRAINEKGFDVHFQAKISMASRALVGFEALARWPCGNGKFIGPDQFIPLAESTGLIVPLSMQILEQVCKALAGWRETQSIVHPVAFNVCARQLMTDEFSKALAKMLDKYGIDPALLELEITESSLLCGMDEIIKRLAEFRRRGHKISIDDFGTGYSSMSYLTQLPLDVLKIDRSFIIGLDTDSGKQAVINTMIELAKNLGLETVAEGIEDAATHEYLKARGCVMGQGYLYAKPMTLQGLLESKILPEAECSKACL
jgi:sensor c-di-GMP phosphodiesterase-like protein